MQLWKGTSLLRGGWSCPLLPEVISRKVEKEPIHLVKIAECFLLGRVK